MTGKEARRERRIEAWGRSRGVGSVLLLLALLVGAQIGYRALVGDVIAPSKGAEWIWAPEPGPDDGPAAYFLGRDFSLDFRPDAAQVVILADEEYFLFVNGSMVGANRYSGGAPLDLYDVAHLLAPGLNRVVVEARSSRGIGAVIFSLEASGEGQLAQIVSDSTWRVMSRRDEALKPEPWPGAPERTAKVWGGPPVGRWGVPLKAVKRPSAERLLPGLDAVPAQWVRPGPGSGPFLEMDPPWPRHPYRLGHWVTFDWGREVTGYLSVRFSNRSQPVGLVFIGDEGPPNPGIDSPNAFVIPTDGRTQWTDSTPRTFRWVTIVGTDGIGGARVLPIDEAYREEVVFEVSEVGAGL